jgi:hypothetical protein
VSEHAGDDAERLAKDAQTRLKVMVEHLAYHESLPLGLTSDLFNDVRYLSRALLSVLEREREMEEALRDAEAWLAAELFFHADKPYVDAAALAVLVEQIQAVLDAENVTRESQHSTRQEG